MSHVRQPYRRWRLVWRGALALAVCFAIGFTPPRTAAQGLVEYALVLVIASISVEEEAIFTVRPANDVAATAPERRSPVHQVRLVGYDAASPSCAFEVDAEIRFGDGLTGRVPVRVAIDRENQTVSVAGELFPIEDCFEFAQRLFLEAGFRLPPAQVEPALTDMRRRVPIAISGTVVGEDGTRAGATKVFRLHRVGNR
jgi:hypothetical protein